MPKEEGNTAKNEVHISKSVAFVKRTALIFLVLFVVLVGIGFAPTSVKELNNSIFSFFIHDKDVEDAKELLNTVPTSYAEPIEISIPAIGTKVRVLNPGSADEKMLDAALLLGAVRYPGSGLLESSETMFLFGHSSYLSVVHNQAYRTFNDIQKLKAGDEIILSSQDKDYAYVVETVEKTNADTGFVSFGKDDHKLVLATCNVFGKKEERFIVTARFVESSVRTNS